MVHLHFTESFIRSAGAYVSLNRLTLQSRAFTIFSLTQRHYCNVTGQNGQNGHFRLYWVLRAVQFLCTGKTCAGVTLCTLFAANINKDYMWSR